MAKKETAGIGKKATEVKAAAKPAAKAEIKEVKKVLPKKEPKPEVKVKVEVKPVPAIKPYEDKPVAKSLGKKAASRIPPKPTGSIAKLEKLQVQLKQAVRQEAAKTSVPEHKQIPEPAQQLPSAATTIEAPSIRRAPPVAGKKMAVTGKLSIDEALAAATKRNNATMAPIFDASKYLKK